MINVLNLQTQSLNFYPTLFTHAFLLTCLAMKDFTQVILPLIVSQLNVSCSVFQVIRYVLEGFEVCLLYCKPASVLCIMMSVYMMLHIFCLDYGILMCWLCIYYAPLKMHDICMSDA